MSEKESPGGRWPATPDEQLHASALWDAPQYFRRKAPLEVEVGSGKARFLIEAARRTPERDFLGIELSLAYYRICRERIARSGLPNLRVVRADAKRFIDTSLPTCSVAAFHIYFPDPWPKKRQRKRRLLDGVFFESLASRLEPGGTIRIATDHADYGSVVDSLLETVSTMERLDWEGLPPPPPTHYEIKYSEEGRPISRFLLRKKRDTPVGA